MDREQQQLEQLRAKMTSKQRAEMADIIQSELIARERSKRAPARKVVAGRTAVNASSISGGLSPEDVGQLYSDVQDALKKTRRPASEPYEVVDSATDFATAMTPATKRRATRSFQISKLAAHFSMSKVALALAVSVLAIAKILFSGGVVDASPSSAGFRESPAALSAPTAEPIAEANTRVATDPKARAALGNPRPTSVSPIPAAIAQDEVLITQLDARRVELQRRSDALDRRENDLKTQTQALAERLAELRNLTTKLDEVRTQEDRQHNERLEQLANVYGSMQPKEAAPLIGKLEDTIALALLERMPGKRIGQILSLMDSERAIELTKQLTARGNGQRNIAIETQ